jgi:hypothetical protein
MVQTAESLQRKKNVGSVQNMKSRGNEDTGKTLGGAVGFWKGNIPG